MVISILAIALLTVVVRLLLPGVWDYRAEIEDYLSERLRTEVSIGEISASWESQFPRLLLQDVVIANHRSRNIGRIELRQLILGFNPVSSLLQWQPVLSKVELWSLHTQVKLVNWPHTAQVDESTKTEDLSSTSDPLAALWLQPHIFFYDTQIDLTLPSGKQVLLQSDHLNLENSPHQHHFAGELRVTHEQREATATLRIESDSYAFASDTKNFDFYLKLAGIDTPLMDAARELLPIPTALEQLELNSEIWGNWSEGRLTRLFGEVDGGRLQLATQQAGLTELSIQQLDSGFALLQPQPGQFQLQVSDFSAQINQQPLSFPQLVINRQRQRIESVALTEFNVTEIASFLEQQAFVPDDLKRVLTTIKPTGMIRHLLLQWPLAEPTVAAANTAVADASVTTNARVNRHMVSSAASHAVAVSATAKTTMVAHGVNSVSLDQAQDWTQLSLQGDLEGIAFEAAYGAPAMSGVTGLLQLQHDDDGLQGRIDLTSDALGLHFPEVFDQGWLFSEAQGVTHFSLAQNVLHLHSEYVELHKAGINASGRWSLYLPLEREIQSELTLLIGVKDADGRLAPELIPDHAIDPGIKAWVAQSIKQGVLNQGGFLLHTGTRSIPSRQAPTVQMFMDISDAEVAYQSGWPAVKAADASLLLRDQGLEIDVSRGQMYDSHIEHGWVYLPPHSQDLHIIASINGDSDDIVSTLLQSPILDGANTELENWRLSGAAQTRLKLIIPLNGADADVDVSSVFKNLELASQSRQLKISQLAGQVSYQTDKGLNAESLNGVLFGQPLKADIISSGQGKSEKITARLRSSIRLSELQNWSGIQLLALAEGVQAYEADLDICLRADCSGLTVKSDLQQTALALIPPYSKSIGQEMPLLLHTDFNSPQTLNIRVGDQLSAWLQLDGDRLSRGHLMLGAADARPSAYPGLSVSGQLPQLNYESLIDMLTRASILSAASTSAATDVSMSQSTVPVQADINVASLGYDDLQMNNARLLLERGSDGWNIGVSGADLNLQVNLPDSDAKVPQLRFQTLNLDALLPEDELSSPVSSEQPANIEEIVGHLQPGDVPDLDIEIADLIVKQKHWGQWDFKVRNRQQSMYVEDIVARLPEFKVAGEIIWRPGDLSQSELTLSVEAKDLSRTLESVGYEKVLQTEKVTAKLEFQWLGAPWEYALAEASGQFSFDARDGRLIEAGSGTGLLRVFGILNMNTLGRRLKLDFSDLYAKGVSFDRMQGNYRIVKGVATTQTPFLMRGPAVDMAASGDIDFVNETVNQQVAVTLPVTDNIPLAAVLLGAPQIAGVAFLLDKLIGDEVKKEIATVTYTMKGDWSDPDVELLRRPEAEKKAAELK
ncbi:AsmA-like C-terminal region-containing protein [Amphritea sp. 1_MG-2023]|uniref:YhdP family phospholipid transporter n=1 Tax=Amphritea sp. 1_MG-2023 TaxID=3062670 RepID=UPI0026E2A621|nr:AsmA-like C-terminal region-containing protein [Amphritea sp. 1_MG-2023]MDO6564072.1 AsmA-like C-terminal region-containing protein [Amphritea sp. 1_MG-2023]